MRRSFILAPLLFGLVGCAAMPVSDEAIALHSPRAAHDALVARCQQPTTLTQTEYDVVCFPGAQPDYLDCVVPRVRPRYSCDIRVHAQAYEYYRPVLIGTVRVTVEAGTVVAATVSKPRPIRVRTPHVTAIGG